MCHKFPTVYIFQMPNKETNCVSSHAKSQINRQMCLLRQISNMNF